MADRPDDATGATPEPGASPGTSGAQPPVRAPVLTRKDHDGAAAGVGAVVSIARHGLAELGPVRTLSLLTRVNQRGGFDCPGCAWPDPLGERTPFEFCENGAKAVAEEATRKTVDAAFFARHPVRALRLWSDKELGKSGRLAEPMVLREGASHYTPITWEEAFGLVAEHLRGLDTPDQAIFYTSGRTSNEAAFLYQLFVRQLGTNNLPDCSNMCHESSGTALTEVLGSGKGPVTLEDLENTDLILIFGQNPGTNHPRMLTSLQRAKRAGARIIAVNPLRERGLERFAHPQELGAYVGRSTPLADRYLQVRVNGDVALLHGLCKALLAREAAEPGSVVDRAFVASCTTGFDELVAHLEALDWADLEAGSGLTRAEIEDAAALVAESERVVACWAMGLTQHENAVANIQGVVNLLLLGGHIGRPGCGPCPVRGHSNVQGDRTMGIWERPTEAFLDRLAAVCGFDPPRHHGVDVVGAIEAMHAGRGRVFFALGGNFLSAAPDTEHTAEALQRCDLTVQVSTKLNRSHLITGRTALILPVLGRTDRDVQPGGEQVVTCENSMGYVAPSRGRLRPPSPHLLSEPRLVARLARATLGDATPTDWEALADDYRRIRDLIGRVVPDHEDYDRRIREDGGFLLPHPNRERRFPTADGRAHFTVHPLPELGLEPGQLLLMTLRSHDQYNTTIYGDDDRYRGLYGERRILMCHPDDLSARGLSEGDRVDITSHHRGRTRVGRAFVVVPYDVPRGNCAAYFPEANVLVPWDKVAHRSRTPTSKSVVVTLAPAGRG
jgi:molybdopterin-dependent oxidoreductase alpha subunit